MESVGELFWTFPASALAKTICTGEEGNSGLIVGAMFAFFACFVVSFRHEWGYLSSY